LFESFPDDRLADAKPCGDRVLSQTLASGQRSVKDPPTQRIRHNG
jgi:hypothetical protein